jgi:hypothetical protein
MTRPLPLRALALSLALFCAQGLPLAAQTADQTPADPPAAEGEMGEGLDLMGKGAQMLLRGLLSQMQPALDEMGLALAEIEPVLRDLVQMIGDIRNYHAPEMLPNGDIILRRKVPLAPPEGEVEL